MSLIFVCVVFIITAILVGCTYVVRKFVQLLDQFPQAKSILEACYLRSAFLQSFFSFRWLTPCGLEQDELSVEELANSCGLETNTFGVTSADGYLLTLYRLRVPSINETVDEVKVPVLLIHGLMQDCESFLCCEREKSLAAVLAHYGFDVWLGNNRGCKYSNGHVRLPASSAAYWDFSIDDLARFDFPAMLDRIISTVEAERGLTLRSTATKVCVVGFSQGSAQVLLSLANSPDLCDSVSLFVALSPPLRLQGSFKDSSLASMLHTWPGVMHALFGGHAMLSWVVLWKNLLSNKAFSQACRHAMSLLFGWTCSNISPLRQHRMFQHIFSPSSVKCVQHWFQICEQVQLRPYHHGRHVSLECCFSRISCPVAAVCGDRDGLIDIHAVPCLLPSCVFSHIQPKYEHLDIIWADDACSEIFPYIVSIIDRFCKN